MRDLSHAARQARGQAAPARPAAAAAKSPRRGGPGAVHASGGGRRPARRRRGGRRAPCTVADTCAGNGAQGRRPCASRARTLRPGPGMQAQAGACSLRRAFGCANCAARRPPCRQEGSRGHHRTRLPQAFARTQHRARHPQDVPTHSLAHMLPPGRHRLAGRQHCPLRILTPALGQVLRHQLYTSGPLSQMAPPASRSLPSQGTFLREGAPIRDEAFQENQASLGAGARQHIPRKFAFRQTGLIPGNPDLRHAQHCAWRRMWPSFCARLLRERRQNSSQAQSAARRHYARPATLRG